MFFESYQLDAALASSCQIKIGHYESSCSCDLNGMTYPGGGGKYFNVNNCDEDMNGPEFDGGETYCYHGPDATGGIMFVVS